MDGRYGRLTRSGLGRDAEVEDVRIWHWAATVPARRLNRSEKR
jgi:hypothetical protein